MYKASVENRGDTRYYATTRHSTFVLDTAGNGANPIDTLLASLCGCVGHYVRDYLVAQRIAHTGFSIDADAGVKPDNARLDGITVSIDLKGVVLDDNQVAELLTAIENCKVHKILCLNPGVTVTLTGRERPQPTGTCC